MVKFIKSHALLSAAFGLALLVTLVFLGRFAMSTLMWSHVEIPNQPVAGWMTPRYVARSWHVPPETVAAALSIDMDGTGRRISIEEIAASQDRPIADVISTLEAALIAAQDRPVD